VLDAQYEKGIAAFHDLGRDAHPDVANYLDYAHRKLGRYEQAKDEQPGQSGSFL
jgi:hypothetical protein